MLSQNPNTSVTPRNTMIERPKQRVWRCRCGWETTHYDEIDGHEDQLDPGHLVTVVKPAPGETA